MSDAYVIEVCGRTAGIVARDSHDHGFNFFFRGAPFQRHGRPVFFRPAGGRARGADACQKRESTAQSPIGASPPRYRPAAFWVELELKKKRGLSTVPPPSLRSERPCFAPENSCSGLVSQCQPTCGLAFRLKSASAKRRGLAPFHRRFLFGKFPGPIGAGFKNS